MGRNIKSNSLSEAAYFALMEARRWREVSKRIESEKSLCREKNVILAYAVELCFKALLMINNFNVTERIRGNGHDLYTLFSYLPNEVKEEIATEVSFETIVVKDFFTGEMLHEYSTFDEILKIVSKDFLDKRYIYEKYTNGEPLLVIEGVLDRLYIIMIKVVENHLKKENFPLM